MLVRTPDRRDAAVAVALCAAAELEAFSDGQRPLTLVIAAAAALALARRRRRPVAVMLAVALAPLLDALLGGSWSDETNAAIFLLMLAAYSVAAHAPLGPAAAAAGAVFAGYVGAALVAGEGLADAPFLLLLLGMPWVSGRVVRGYRGRAARLRALTAELALEREASAELARAEERQRLARDVHDAVAAAVHAMVARTETAERLPPAGARDELRSAQAIGREAVAELRRVVGILRAGARSFPPPAHALPEPPPARVWWPPGADAALAAVLTAWSATYVVTLDQYAGVRGPVLLLVAAAGVAVAVRARHPLAALTCGVAAGNAEALLTGTYSETATPLVAELLALYSLAAGAPARRAAAGLVVALAGSNLVPLVAGHSDAADMLLLGAFVLVPWGAGRAVRAQRRQADELRVLAARLAAERDARARLAVTEERTRAARELHDSIAHSVSVMVLQAGAAEAVLAAAPGRARAAMRAVTAQGRQALAELRAVLGVLDPAAAPPAPGLDRLDALIAGVRRAGLPAEIRVRGQQVPLPPAVEASAYRIIQEALTNALKHAGSAPTTVTLAYAPATLAVEIRDAGASLPTGRGGGHGLVGMRERAAAHGGALQAGPRAGGGFSVRADLPLSGTRA